MSKDHLLVAPTYSRPVTDEFLQNGNPRGRQPVIACVWVRPKYQLQHVLTLKSMVDRHCGYGYQFVCLTDHDEAYKDLRDAGVYPLMTRGDLPGWWQKLKLFDPLLWSGNERILYLDLDVVIADNIDAFFKGSHHMNAIANFGINYKHSKYNSSVMSWEAQGRASKIWQAFCDTGPEKVMKRLHGDQCWIWRVMQDDILTWPVDWAQSYKYDIRSRRNPAKGDPRIVVFHGDPKPWDVANDPLVKEHYR